MNTPQSHTVAEPEVLPVPTEMEPLGPALREELLAQVDERGQVTVHCHHHSAWETRLRIWQSTYLVCRQTRHRSSLVHAEGIPFMPTWMSAVACTTTFTLVFTPLPDGCTSFDLLEEIPESGGFHVPGIRRNGRDLYDVLV
jgi:hypothetical protein